MKIFVSYCFDDTWIPRSIFPLFEAMGFEVESGRDIAGQVIDEGVKRKIQGCGGLVAFLTRRTPVEGSDRFKASDWVIQEYTYASAMGMPILEVRESGGLLAGNRQWIFMDPDDRLAGAAELCRALREWSSGVDIELRLRTQAFVEAIQGRLNERKYRCTYVLRHRDGREMVRVAEAHILPRAGGLIVYAKNVPKDAFIEFRIEFGGEVWTSLGREVQSIDIDLQKEGAL